MQETVDEALRLLRQYRRQAPQQAHGDALAALRFLINSSTADHQALRNADEVIRPYLTASGVPEEVRRLAFRCLWIAFAWNDHNFSRNPEKYAREEAEAVGITSAEEAGQFMSQIASAPADGYKLVPIKPTKDMCHAGCEVSVSPDVPAEIWNAMIAAAPTDGME